MPFKTYNTKADFDSDYRFGAEPDGRPNTRAEVKLHYHRAVMMPAAIDRAARIEGAMGWSAPGPVMVIVGAGFSFLAEAFEARGYTRVVGIDTSPFIQTAKSTTEESEINEAISAVGLDPASGRGAQIKARVFDGGVRARASRGVLNEDANANASRNRIRSALGLSGEQQPGFLVSEDVLPALTDLEFVDLSTRLRAWVPNILHVVTTAQGQTSAMNLKTLTAWKALAPLDIFLDASTFDKL